jgi:phosphatidate cytidylyltransferase
MSGSSTPPAARRGRLASRLVAAAAVLAAFTGMAWADTVGLGSMPPMTWLLPIVLSVAAGGGREAVRLSGAAGMPLDPLLVPVGAAVIAAAPAVGPLSGAADGGSLGSAAVAIMGVLAATFAAGVARYSGTGRDTLRAAGSVAAAVAIGLPLAFMVALRLLPDATVTGRPFSGLLPVVSLIAVVKGGDIAAYAIGSLLGRHRLAPRLSPGKTWEGAVASLAASAGTAWLVLERIGGGPRPFGGWLAFGLLVGGAGMLGDLAESLVKRDLGAKDSGSSLGGMGGFLDLVDSLLLAAPVAWLLWSLG